MPDFTIVTAVSADYLKRLRWSLPTWTLKPQFKTRPLIVYSHGIAMKDLAWLRDYFDDVTILTWGFAGIPVREAMLSTFVLGAGKDVKTSHFVKLDADCYFTDAQDAFKPEDFEVDLAAHKWSYTKPRWWIEKLDAWANGRKWNGDKSQTGSLGAKRIISWCCLHKTEFVREAARCAGSRLPVPSHDTYLWYLANLCTDRSFKRLNLKARGVNHCHRWRGLRENICASEAAWNPYLNREILKHVQLEITTACNLACPNCDRNCGTAPSDERMTVKQIHQFLRESFDANHRWARLDIIGGEPCLHPELMEILECIKGYVPWDPKCKVRLTTNGTGDKVKRILAIIAVKYPWIQIRNSAKEKGSPKFEAVNLAPIDTGLKHAQSCSIPWRCGLGLSRYGYYLCGAGASIGRIFGLVQGIKRLADVTPEALRKQKAALCLYCGHSRSIVKETREQETSPSWRRAFKRYKKRKLALY